MKNAKFKKVYVEITNVCNLDCSFCHGTKRNPGFMTAGQFSLAAGKLRPYSDYIYLHLMGEPLLHPELEKILEICRELDYHTAITTNGTLLKEKYPLLEGIYKLSVSLHSFEANENAGAINEYLDGVISAARYLSQRGTICVLRLWNENGKDKLNGGIEKRLSSEPDFCAEQTAKGIKLAQGLYLEYGEKFDWPDLGADVSAPRFCMGLRDQIGVLCDGTVVPCCLDAEGTLSLGNIFTDAPEEIFGCKTAKLIYDGFSRGKAAAELCGKCGYAALKFGKQKI